MSRKKIISHIALFITVITVAQTPKKAERLFQKGDFIEAAQLYEEALLVKNWKTVLERLSDCYYNTYQYDKGLLTLKSIIDGNFDDSDKKVAPRFNFMYYQLLSSSGDYEKAIEQLVVYKDKMQQEPPNAQESIEMVETLRLKKANFEIKATNFNSKASDFAAVKLNDSVYFSSDRGASRVFQKDYKWTHRPFLNLYALGLDSLNKASGDAKLMPKIINSNLHEGSFTFTQDGKELYFSRSNLVNGKRIFTDDNKNQIQLYKSKLLNGKWSEPEKLSFCSNAYNFQHPTLSKDEKILYYSSDSPESIGSFDIFYVNINEDGTYGNPTNLGDKINTIDREQYPYISEEGYLFFASNGHLGLGLLDVFVSKLESDTFTTPVNLGAPINSRYDDFSLIYSSKKEGYFSSNRDYTNDDIFAFKQINDLFIREYVNTFKVQDSISGEPVANTQIKLKNNNGEILYENLLGSKATFTANLLPGNYTIKMSTPGFDEKTKTIEILEKNNGKHIILMKKSFDVDMNETAKTVSVASKKIIIKLIKDKTPPRIIVADSTFYLDVPFIYFDFDRWEIKEESKILINNLIYKLGEYPSLKIRINSHTDSRGTTGYNQLLSEKRGQSTRNYLVNVGRIASDRVSFEGYGESKLLIKCADNCTEKNHQENRRSQFEIIEY